MTRIFTSLIATAATSIALMAAPTTASAESTPEQTRIAVRYADLDLSTVAGRKSLDRRVKQAAERACGFEPDIGDLRAMMFFNRCFAEAYKSGQEQVAARTGAQVASR